MNANPQLIIFPMARDMVPEVDGAVGHPGGRVKGWQEPLRSILSQAEQWPTTRPAWTNSSQAEI